MMSPRLYMYMIGRTAWPIWKNRENAFKELQKNVEKSAKNEISQKKSGKSREANYLEYDVFGWFLTYLSILFGSKPIKT